MKIEQIINEIAIDTDWWPFVFLAEKKEKKQRREE